MGSANIGWLFYKEYFNGLDYIQLLDKKNTGQEQNTRLIAQKTDALLSQKLGHVSEEIMGSTRFQGTTTYPGLLLGSGYAHELPNIKGQAILGFHFDYTSGLPVIPGSTIKGVLRSAFAHPEYVAALTGLEIAEVKMLEAAIFENADIFFDATIIDAGKSGYILGDDYITPHRDPLKDPVPLRFVKVLPEVTFLFQFELSDSQIGERDFEKKRKEELFRAILADLGLGAKTNVGYGSFRISDAPKTEAELEAERIAEEEAKAERKAREEAALQQAKAEKEAKKQEGISKLLSCKSLEEGFRLLKETFGKKPNPTPEERAVIEQYFKKQKNLSKADKKVFKKYGIE
jgi:CRISPR-associated protein Cmr6